MSGVETIEVAVDEAGLRLDRWFRRRYPSLAHGRLEKLLRTGQVRIDGRRAKAGNRLEGGQQVRVPPLPEKAGEAPVKRAYPKLDASDRASLREMILHVDRHVIAIDKPPGLAVQGGTGTHRHLDAMLEGLKLDGTERPRLVHRLDKDTSGVLLLARSAKAATALTRAFHDKRAQKTYWAIVTGVPEKPRGRIDLPLAKRAGTGGERVVVAKDDGKRALTDYAVLDRAGRRVAWLALRPLTGRTHQLRAHLAALGTPILGDGKYGRRSEDFKGLDIPWGLRLHAHTIVLPHPAGGMLSVTAALPPAFIATMRQFGFEPGSVEEAFPEEPD